MIRNSISMMQARRLFVNRRFRAWAYQEEKYVSVYKKYMLNYRPRCNDCYISIYNLHNLHDFSVQK